MVSGDSLSKIANQYDVSVAAIRATNGLSSDTILIGQELLIPVDATLEVQSTVPVEPAVEEKVVIKPIVDNSISKENTSATTVQPAEPELKSVENAETEIDVESFPQVDYLRVPAQSE